MEYLYKEVISKSELFVQHMEDNFLHWGDDQDMMDLLVANYMHKPHLFNFLQLISKEKLEYAKELLLTVIYKKEYCLELITAELGPGTHRRRRHAAHGNGRMRIPLLPHHPYQGYHQRVHRPGKSLQHASERTVCQWHTGQYP